ncbi:glycoside hydrolase [Mycolicibacterium arabiense]|uniref:Glycoside hydrolase n=1 Tax=Mycolicibacterium arabiense TaxID=1286181 RepID=A0A7I7RX33_9MYCO|nr:C40 family peptidase [Mycolicibacterium arabiense]MCV7373862.1 C40 family peptidase [Mycolicibacterium arabiense]BBY49107.1 glycoside hydrolase [Mycolicibacterium arabiense]
MPGSVTAALAAPLHDLRATLGTGSTDVAGGLTGLPSALADVAAALSSDTARTNWTGEAAVAADDFTRHTVEAIEALAGRAERLGATVGAAADAVARARARLDAIIDAFEARAAELEPHLDEPGVAEALAAEAQNALDEAATVVDGLTTDLATHQAAVTPPTASTTPPTATPTSPAGWSAAAPLSAAASGLRSMAAAPAGSTTGGSPSSSPGRPVTTTRPEQFGSETAINLPGGGSATAPNEVAASAVRHALTQLGVPYDWGGTTPGVGLDCSGLTQWAYREAGLDIPRLAQEQDIGAPVDGQSLRPGDLAVWDGHVAMIVGEGLMVEAGDPVQLSPVRTTNAGQGFQGFWRPTA